MAPTENVAADAKNDGSEANTGIVSAREGTNTSLEVSIVSGVSGMSVRASADAGEVASSVGSKHHIFILLVEPTPASTPTQKLLLHKLPKPINADALQHLYHQKHHASIPIRCKPICISMGFPIIFPWMTTAEDGVARNGCIAGAFLWRIQQSATLRVFFLLVILPMLANAKLGV